MITGTLYGLNFMSRGVTAYMDSYTYLFPLCLELSIQGMP